jgi:hypothetical protein
VLRTGWGNVDCDMTPPAPRRAALIRVSQIFFDLMTDGSFHVFGIILN